MYGQLMQALNQENIVKANELLEQMTEKHFKHYRKKMNWRPRDAYDEWDSDSKPDWHNSALHVAASKGYAIIVSSLLDKKPNLIDVVDDSGDSALHVAAQFDQPAVVSILLARNADRDLTNNSGESAMSLARDRDHSEIVELFESIEEGVDLERQLTIERNIFKLYALKQIEAQGKGLEFWVSTLQKLGQETDGLKEELRVFKEREVQEAARLAKEAQLKLEQERLKQEAEGKKFVYSAEKIDKLFEVQLKGKKNLDYKVLDLEKSKIPEGQIQDFIKVVMEQDKTLAIAMHLHGDAWANMLLKKQGDNLQIIYNDPTGNPFAKEREVQNLINSVTEHHHQGDTITTDLRQKQQNVEIDSGALVVDNLIRLATTNATKKSDLQRLLPKAEDVNNIREKHLLMEETSPLYSEQKLGKLLEIALKGKGVTIAPITIFENEGLLVENVKIAVQQVIKTGRPTVIPLHMQDNQWSGLVIKLQADGELQVIYTDPRGSKLMAEKNAKLLIGTIMEINLDTHIFDIMQKQQDSNKDSGVFIIDNLVRLAIEDTSKFNKADFGKLLVTSAEANNIRLKHVKLLHQEGIPVTIPDYKHDGDVIGDLQLVAENQECHEGPPPYSYHNDDHQLHVSGDVRHD